MATLNLDSNRWYQIQVESYGSGFCLDGSVLYDHGQGAVFLQETNTTHIEQNWQILPLNNASVLRTQGSGPNGVLVASVGNTTTPGNTVASMVNSSLADSSMYWQINPWGDGTFFFTNLANGTDWHLTILSNALTAMSSNVSKPQPGQSYSFNPLGTIDDVRFSSVLTASSIASTTSSSTSSQTSSSTSVTSTSSSGLSTGAKAGIGIGVVLVALIALIGLGFYLMRRRKRQRQTKAQPADLQSQPTHEMTSATTPKKQHLDSHGGPRYSELPTHQVVSEMPAYPNTSELPS